MAALGKLLSALGADPSACLRIRLDQRPHQRPPWLRCEPPSLRVCNRITPWSAPPLPLQVGPHWAKETRPFVHSTHGCGTDQHRAIALPPDPLEDMLVALAALLLLQALLRCDLLDDRLGIRMQPVIDVCENARAPMLCVCSELRPSFGQSYPESVFTSAPCRRRSRILAFIGLPAMMREKHLSHSPISRVVRGPGHELNTIQADAEDSSRMRDTLCPRRLPTTQEAALPARLGIFVHNAMPSTQSLHTSWGLSEPSPPAPHPLEPIGAEPHPLRIRRSLSRASRATSSSSLFLQTRVCVHGCRA